MFDRATFEEVTGGDPEAAREIAELLTGEARELLSEMETALAVGDEEVVQRTAHSMKSSLGSVGAPTASAIAAKIEKGGLAAAREEIGAFRREVDKAIAALDDYVSQIPAT